MKSTISLRSEINTGEEPKIVTVETVMPDTKLIIYHRHPKSVFIQTMELTKIPTVLPARGRIDRYQDFKIPWHRVHSEGSETFKMKKWNYKVYEDFGVRQMEMSRNIAVLDTGTVPNFVHASQVPDGDDTGKIGLNPNICD